MRSLSLVFILVLGAACGKVSSDALDGGGDDDDVADASLPDAQACTTADSCPPDRPICDDQTHTCVQCLGPADCNEDKPTCDAEQHVCRGCDDHDECASRVCNDDGKCEVETNVVYADAVTGSGDLNSCGTLAMPCSFLNSALEHWGPSRPVLRLLAGTFNGTPIVATFDARIIASSGVSLNLLNVGTGQGTAGVTLDGGNTGSRRLVVDGLEVKNHPTGSGFACTNRGVLELRDVDSHHHNQNGASSDLCSVEIYGSRFHDNVELGLALGGFDQVVEGNLIQGNTRGGVGGFMSSLDFRNNLLIGNSSAENYFGAIRVNSSEGPLAGLIAYNTFVGNYVNGAYIGIINCGSTNSSVIVSSNLIHGNVVQGGNIDEQTVIDCKASLVNKNISDAELGTGNTKIDDPRFVDATGHDYHLATGSPALDKGDPSDLVMPPIDRDGHTRPNGAGPDVGCYER